MSMAGYTKLFNSILASTIWREDDKTRIVWITLLAMADKNGVAEGSVPGLADFARVSVAACRRALDKLQQPDRESRSGDSEGRRIQVVDGGWRIINHGKYRAKLSQDERREYLRQKQAESRRKRRVSTNVNNVSDKSTQSTHSEAEADTEAVKKDQDQRATPAAVRKHLISAAWSMLENQPSDSSLSVSEITNALKAIAAKSLRAEWSNNEIAGIVDEVLAQWDKRRA